MKLHFFLKTFSKFYIMLKFLSLFVEHLILKVKNKYFVKEILCIL